MILVAAGFLLALVDPSAIMVEQRTTVRVRSRQMLRIPRREDEDVVLRWREQRGPRCIAAADLAGAAVNEEDSVDLILRGGGRVRAELERRCPTMDYYSGFYVRPGGDGSICADRDAIRSRSGRSCGIDRFRRLVPERERR